MASVNSHADVVIDWMGLIEATARNPEVQEVISEERQVLSLTLTEVSRASRPSSRS